MIKLMKNMKKFASVNIPVVGGKSSLSMLVKLPRCVEQQVASTSVSVSNFLQHLLKYILPRNSVPEWQHCGLLGFLLVLDGGLPADDKLLFVCGVYQWRLYGFGLCLQLAESFSTSSSTWEMIAESFTVSSIQLAGSVWMPV